jgi:hypothetical protein
MEEYNYTLTTSFKYGKDGELEDARIIKLLPPSVKDLKYCSELKQAFFRAMPKNNKVTDEEREAAKKEGKLKGSDIMFLINASPDVELTNVLLNAKELFTSKSNLAMVDGEERMTKPLIESMSLDDLENMTGEYLANFILASSLEKMKDQ